MSDLMKMAIRLLFFVFFTAGRAMCCRYYEDITCQQVNIAAGKYFSNKFIVQLEGGEERAKSIAERNGFTFLHPIDEFEGHYYFRKDDVPQKHKMKHEPVLRGLLESDDKVKTADQQYVFDPDVFDMNDFVGMIGHETAQSVMINELKPDTIKLERDFRKTDIKRKDETSLLPPLGRVWSDFKERTKYRNKV